MTTEEKEAAISGLLKERSRAKWRRLALEGELRTAGKSLYDIGSALKNQSMGTMGSRVDYILPKFDNVPATCDLNRVREMLEELKELQTRLNQLNQSASQMGID
jgi:hypothetical protein